MTAEDWRALIVQTFEAAAPATQREWRADFLARKVDMLSYTLTVENRTGRRFDREAYQQEAAVIYSPETVPCNASPKLLARCFQHSIDFIHSRRLVEDVIDEQTKAGARSAGRPLSTPTLSTSAASSLKRSRASANEDSLQPSASSTCASQPPTSRLCASTASPDDEDGAESVSHLLFGSCEELTRSWRADTFLQGLDDDLLGMLPDVQHHTAAVRVASEGAVAVTTNARQVYRRSASVESQCTAASEAMQVKADSGAAQEIHRLGAELAALQEDLAAARAQRDAAVDTAQAAMAYASQLQQQHDVMHITALTMAASPVAHLRV